MKNRIYITLAILAVLWLNVVSVQAETEVLRLTDNGYMDILPAINGNSVVWQGYQADDWEVFLYDIAEEQTMQISANDYPDIAPQTDGSYVVWLGMNSPGGNIFYYDINSGGILQVTNNDRIKSPPQIADGSIVWAAQEVADSVLPGDIELYDIEAGTTTTISTPADPDGNLDDHTPAIDSTKVVWVQTGLNDISTTVFVHDLTSGETFPAPDNFATVQSPTQDSNLAITTRFDGQDKEIFLRHQGLRKNMQITDNGVDEKHPRIHDNHLVWVSGPGPDQEIYLGITRLLFPVSPGDGFVYNKKNYPVFEWEAIGYNRFRVQFSAVASFEYTLNFPESGDAWLSEPSITLEKKQAAMLKGLIEDEDEGEGTNNYLYWRILAQDQYGNETTSQMRRIMTGEKKK
jgi:beta propeller repeat protein